VTVILSQPLAAQIHPAGTPHGVPPGKSAARSSPGNTHLAAPPDGTLHLPAPGAHAAAGAHAQQGGALVAQALQYAAQHPEAQPVIHGALRGAAKYMVKEVARRGLRRMVDVHTYVQENPSLLRVISLVVAAALLFTSGLSLINVQNIIAKPFEYLFSVYDALFAAVIFIIEGKPEWFERCSLQSMLFGRAAFLASQTGRAIFYLYVGTMNLYTLPHNWLWKLVYLGMGGGLCAVGVLTLLYRYGCCCRAASNEVSSSSEDEAESGRSN